MRLMRGSVLFTVNVFNTFVMLRKLRNPGLSHISHSSCLYFERFNPYLFLQAFQLGPTEASQYWVYWVPAQFVDAIKDTVLGKWQYF